MPELSRRLKWQRRIDDHAATIGHTIAYAAFTVFLVGLIWAVVTGGSLRWAIWLIIPVLVGAAIATYADEEREPGGPHRYP